ncbi:NADP(H)-dependent aldo-keto reductase [Marinobacterium sediminicola]|uniref:Predicted oxidoreductase n=1 Tax=Marinobacterium sediminicola TaxID=518898 RepID=A0ABY1RZN0_9GAMM|nr:NADP(H)-dependent aldo-keto reductase [Marinobacterium sediminicola]ULG69056.1 NADP(H)-dependent aldo-keto reductase [Marinobacterium sediminicola]SMR73690.1 Predicted oxidoreductase [Marinobacterium sediminicola]
MDYLTLGQSDLKVSRIALGTMTFGRQNSEAEAFEQLDYALERGVNLIDAAEMYPVPTAAEFQGRTELFIGNWMRQRGNRDQVVLATKATGPGDMVSYLRPDIRHDAHNLRIAIEGSLKRLQTDYIDLYQLHWPDRSTNYFGQLGYRHDPGQPGTPLEETLSVLAELVREGKVRYVGLSNETPWGTMKCLQLAEQSGLPRIVSVQNPYSLLNRTAEVGLAEVLLREQVGLLAYSPLGFGVLSGKYAGGTRPAGSRLALFPEYKRYLTEQGQAATQCYLELAAEFGLDPAQMALAYVNTRPFLGSNIIGATRMEQLKANLDSLEVSLSAELLARIEAIHQRYPNPCP